MITKNTKERKIPKNPFEKIPIKLLSQTLPLLIICGIAEIFTGSLFHNMLSLLKENPGIIVLIPAMMSLRGNINTTFVSRLGSAYHLGLITKDDMWNKEMRENIIATLFLGITISLIAGFFAFLTCLILGIQSASLKIFLIIALISGAISSILLLIITIGVIILAFRKGYDPDNITAPALATIGDFITISSIFFALWLVSGGV